MDDEAARLVDTLLRSGAAWKATALQQSMSIATIVLSAAMAFGCDLEDPRKPGTHLPLCHCRPWRRSVRLLRKRRVKSDFLLAKRSVFALW